MAYKIQISEILSKLKEFTGEGAVARKVNWLQQNDSPTLRMVLRHGFDPAISYDLPDGDPPFKRNEAPIGVSETTLYAETRRLSYLWAAPSTESLNDLTIAQREAYDIGKADQKAKHEALAVVRQAEQEAIQEIQAAQLAVDEAKRRLQQGHENLKNVRHEVSVATQRTAAIDNRVKAMDAAIDKISQTLRERETPQTGVKLPKFKKELLFIELLESLHQDEADVLLAVKNKALTKKFAINKDVVKKAFPDLIPDPKGAKKGPATI